MNDTLKKWLLYGMGGLLPVWLLDTVLMPRFAFVAPVLLPLCVVSVAVLEGGFSGSQFGLCAGILWALTYAGASTGRIALLTLVGMVSGVVSQYALRRTLSGALVCAAGMMTLLSAMNLLRGLINDVATLGPLLGTALSEWVVTMLWAPLIYFWFYQLYRKAGGKPA